MVKQPETRLIVRVKEDRLSLLSTLHILDTFFVYVDPEDGKIKNPSSFYSYTSPWEATVANLRVHAQAGETDPDFYGFRAEYFDFYSLDLRQAEICVKTLRRLERHLEKRQQQFGYPSDIWAYLGRFAEAFKVDTYGWQVDPRAADYTGDKFQWGDIDFIRHQVEQWRKAQVA